MARWASIALKNRLIHVGVRRFHTFSVVEPRTMGNFVYRPAIGSWTVTQRGGVAPMKTLHSAGRISVPMWRNRIPNTEQRRSDEMVGGFDRGVIDRSFGNGARSGADSDAVHAADNFARTFPAFAAAQDDQSASTASGLSSRSWSSGDGRRSDLRPWLTSGARGRPARRWGSVEVDRRWDPRVPPRRCRCAREPVASGEVPVTMSVLVRAMPSPAWRTQWAYTLRTVGAMGPLAEWSVKGSWSSSRQRSLRAATFRIRRRKRGRDRRRSGSSCG